MVTTVSLFKKDFYERFGGLELFRDKTVLDLGCGDGEDAVEISMFAKKVTGLDIQSHENWRKLKRKNLRFDLGVGEKLPFKSNSFDGLFLKDVLHHVDDIEKTLREIKRVTTKGAVIVIIEGNRYNPLFYVHMTKIGGHEHLSQEEFKKLIKKYFKNIKFIHFESHFVPFINFSTLSFIIKIERVLDKIKLLQPILSYNAAIIHA